MKTFTSNGCTVTEFTASETMAQMPRVTRGSVSQQRAKTCKAPNGWQVVCNGRVVCNTCFCDKTDH